MDALLGFDAASGWAQFRAAAALLAVPSQNLVYADVHGTVADQLAGLVPLRRAGDGTTPVPGWETRYDWDGTIPFAQLPYDDHPPSGIVVAANNQVVGDRYPYVLGSSFSYGWRSEEIADRLDAARGLTPDSAEQILYDERLRFAATLVPELLKVRVADGFVREGQQTLVGWDYTMSADSPAAAYFAIVTHDLKKLVLVDQLAPELWPQDDDRWYAALDTLMQQPDNPWWDDAGTPQVEHRDDVLLAALTLARKEATSLMSRDPGGVGVGQHPPGPAAEPGPGDQRPRSRPVAVQPGGRCGRRRRDHGQGPRLGRPGAVRGHVRLGDADGRRPRGPGLGPLGQPERRLRPPLRSLLRGPVRALARRPDVADGPDAQHGRRPDPCTPWSSSQTGRTESRRGTTPHTPRASSTRWRSRNPVGVAYDCQTSGDDPAITGEPPEEQVGRASGRPQ